ncbi:MAG: hypothetical protein JNK70_04290 [Phycisphaerae bacterium]|nr:hypothetical protein [Phycisphaerae bacterium]
MSLTPLVPRPARELLGEFLCGRDVGCPVCGYNLRDVGAGVCPECGMELTLHVHPIRAGSATSAAGMFGVVLGIVGALLVLVLGIGFSRGLAVLATGGFLVAAGVVQLCVWERYHRRVRTGRPDLVWVYVASGWVIPAALLLWWVL